MADRGSNRDAVIRDAVILGGGPAGLAAAIALRQRGIDCLVIEPLGPEIDKGCGEGLMPDALASLRELGVEITGEDGQPFRGICFANAAHRVHASFPDGSGMGVRRTRLHQLIRERAQQAGVEVLWGSRATLLDRHSISIIEINDDRRALGGNRRKVSFRWLIGADGQSSRLRQWAGLDEARRESFRFGFRRHYKVAPWSEYVEVHWGAPGQIYVTPVAPESVCVAFVTRHPQCGRAGSEDFLDCFPAIAHRLRDAPAMSQRRGAVSATRKLRRVIDGSTALVGDASGSVDAITGEGLALSFRQAIALARAIEKGDLGDYAKAHREMTRLPLAMSGLMLAMDRWPAIERRAMAALSSHPAFFDQLLAVHVGAKSLSRFALRHGPGLGWHLLQASLS